MKATVNNPLHRTINRNAVAFSEEDWTRFNPWRAPGSAPVMDACGLAGGDFLRSNGAEAGDYTKTIYAQHGDVGTKDAIAIGLAAIEGTFGIGTEDALGIASEGALGIASGLAAIRGAH